MVLTFPPSPKSDTPLPPPEEVKLFSKVKRRRGLERIKAARFFWRPFVKNIPDHAGFFLLLLFLADDDVRPNCHPRKKKKKQHWKERERSYKILVWTTQRKGTKVQHTQSWAQEEEKTAGWRENLRARKECFFFFYFFSFLFPLLL